MEMDLNQIPIGEVIKIAAKYRQCSVKNLREKFNEKCGANYGTASFSRKMANGSFNFDELKTIGNILGFKFELKFVNSEQPAE